MSGEKFTQGEWQSFAFDGQWFVAVAGDVEICGVNICLDDNKEVEANMNLISAAPDMYRVLSNIDFDDGMIAEALGDEFQDSVIAALSKARGEP